MTAAASRKSSGVRTHKVRFLRLVKMGKRWYAPGDEASLSAKIARNLSKLGLVEKLRIESQPETSSLLPAADEEPK